MKTRLVTSCLFKVTNMRGRGKVGGWKRGIYLDSSVKPGQVIAASSPHAKGQSSVPVEVWSAVYHAAEHVVRRFNLR